MKESSARSFQPEALAFLSSLSRNNNREWFAEHKVDYEKLVLEPAFRFIEAMQKPLSKMAPQFVAVPKRVGGSLMRVHRDTRFSHNKSPYKTNIGIQFRHEQARDVHAPGFYVHVAPERTFIGAGMWRPDATALRAIRERIVERPVEWRKASRGGRFTQHFVLAGEQLLRPPRGFDKEHEFIDDIRRKDFIAICEFDPLAAIESGFQKAVEKGFKETLSYMEFLCRAVNVPF